MNALYFVAQRIAAEQILDDLVIDLENARAQAPRCRARFAPAQLALYRLGDPAVADALRLLSPSLDDSFDAFLNRLRAVKNPNLQGKGIKKTAHSRPNRTSGEK